MTLAPGKRVFEIREEITDPEFYTYEAQFIPEDPASDIRPQNNRASAFTHVRGSGQVLLIEDFENRGEFDVMVEGVSRRALRQSGLTQGEIRRTGAVELTVAGRARGGAPLPDSQRDDEARDVVQLSSRTEGDLIVFFDAPRAISADLIGRTVRVRIGSAEHLSLHGVRVQQGGE